MAALKETHSGFPYELARAKKAGSVISRQAAGWFYPQVHPPESRGEYALLADLCGSDADVERWLQSHAHRPIVAKACHGAGTPNSLPWKWLERIGG